MSIGLNSSASTITIDKNQYTIGNVVEIDLGLSDYTNIYLSIISDSEVYRFLGIPENPVKFIPKTIGNYSIKLFNLSNNSLISIYNFNVEAPAETEEEKEENKEENKSKEGLEQRIIKTINETINISSIKEDILNKNKTAKSDTTNTTKENVAVFTDKINYTLGEKIIIRIEPKTEHYHQLYISSEDSTYKFLGIPEKELTFIPKNSGKYYIELRDDTKLLSYYEFTIIQDNTENPPINSLADLKEKIAEITKYTKTKKPELRPIRNHFKPDEDPTFNFEFEKTKNQTKPAIFSTLSYPKKQTGKWESDEETIKTRILDSKNRLTSLTTEIEEVDDGKFKISIQEERAFRPGLYFLEINFSGSGEDTIIKQNFTWGVLAINTHKSIYLENELADIGIAVLDNNGKMVCDANVTLEITDPAGIKTTLTTPQDIIVTEACRIYDITQRPDYYTNYSINSAGTYLINLTAITKDGTWNIQDNFSVSENVDFDVSRGIPQTRIYPAVNYIMNISIKADKGHNGIINEYVPASFDISLYQGMTITTIGDTKILSWDVNLKAGDTISLAYEYDAPDVSPEFYLLGRLNIGSWEEARYWQIASDAANGQLEDTLFSCEKSILAVGERTNCTGVYEETANKVETWIVWLEDDAVQITRDDCLGDDFKITDVDLTTDNTECNSELDGAVTCTDWGKQVANQYIRWEIEACLADVDNQIITAASSSTQGTFVLDNVSVIETKAADYSINISINGNPNTDNTIDYITNATINGTCGAQAITCYLYGNVSGTMEMLASDNTLPFVVRYNASIPAGSYTFQVNSTNNITGRTNYLTVNKAGSSIQCLINGSQSNFGPYRYPFDVNVTANLVTPAAKTANISIDSFVNNSGSSPLIQITTINKGGNFTANCSFDGNQNYSSISESFWIYSNFAPYWSQNKSNDTAIYQGEDINLSVEWGDDYGLSHYIFGTNLSGSLVNSSPILFTGSPETTWNTSIINHTPGIVIGWQFFANDSYDAWNQTDIFSFTVLGIRWNDTAALEMGLIEVGDHILDYKEILSYGTNVNVHVDCSGSCTEITDDFPDTIIMNDEDTITVTFDCSSNKEGSYSANFSVYSNTDTILDIITVNCTVKDQTAPYWQDNVAYPASPINYSPGQKYQFNVTWNDNTGVANVTIEHNFTGILKNYSVDKDGNVYYYDIYDLSVGSYVWRYFANDSTGNLNLTDQWIYAVNKSDSFVNLTLNGSDDDIYILPGEEVNITGRLLKPANGFLQIFENGIPIYNGNDLISNIRAYPAGGNYNITLVYENSNYTNSTDSLFVYVQDFAPPIINLNYPENNSYLSVYNITFNFTLSDNVGLKNATLWANFSGTWQENETNQTGLINGASNFINVSWLAEGQYIWNVLAYDTSGNSNFSVSNFTLIIDRTPPAIEFIAPTPVNNSNQTGSAAIINVTHSEYHPDSITLYWNGTNETYRYSGGCTNITKNNLEDGTYTYYVWINDSAGNSNQTETYTLTKDSTPPSLFLVSPFDNRWNSSSLIKFEYNVSDNIMGVNNCSLVMNIIDKASDGTLTGSYTSSEGDYTNLTYNDNSYWYVGSDAPFAVIDAFAEVAFNLSSLIIDENDVSGINFSLNYCHSRETICNGNNATGNAEIGQNVSVYNYSSGKWVTLGHLNFGNGGNETNSSYSAKGTMGDFINDSSKEVKARFRVQFANQNPGSASFLVMDLSSIIVTAGKTNNTVQEGILQYFERDLPDGSHDWSIHCYDILGNVNISETRTINIDTVTPTKVTLLSPPDNTTSNNQNPLLNWTQTTENNFANYTIHVDNDQSFSSIDHIYYTYQIDNTSFQVADTWLNKNHWYWRVIAYDKAGNSNISEFFNYTVDIDAPELTLITENNTYSNTLTNTIQYSVNDFVNVSNCSLSINNKHNQTDKSIIRGITQSFIVDFSEEQSFYWNINCTDLAGNINVSETRLFTIDISSPLAFNINFPKNNTNTKNQTPSLNWSNSSDINFANYTLLIDDSSDFTSPLRYYTYNETNTSYDLTSPLADNIWYWRVIAHDKAGNTRNSTDDFVYIVDTAAPNDFNLYLPSNNTASANNTPFLNWTQSSDDYFTNYTIYVDDNRSFSSINFTYYTFNSTNNSYSVTAPWTNNTIWYWRVIAYDIAGNIKNSTDIFVYITDNRPPVINLSAPGNDSEQKSSVINFEFNVTDLSYISNCSLIIDGQVRKTETSIQKNVLNTITGTFTNGYYDWSINCTDAAGNINESETRRLNINVTLPQYRFYESWFQNELSSANINLSTQIDGTQNTIILNDIIGLNNFNNATLSVANISKQGFLIPASSTITFSSFMDAQSPGSGFLTWEIYKVNSSGEYLICQIGDNAGTAPPAVEIDSNQDKQYIGSCTSPASSTFLSVDDSFKLVTNLNSLSAKDYTKYVDDLNTYVEIQGYALGNLTVTLVEPGSDPKPGEGEYLNLSCLLNCELGYCLETNVYAQFNTSKEDWKDISTDQLDNIILNISQNNPVVLGIINTTTDGNFSLLANNVSEDNNIRCFAASTYADAISDYQNVSILDKTAPNISLVNPIEAYSGAPQTITFSYIPKDAHLKNCSLYGNFSGIWTINQTNTTLVSGQTNYFQPVYLSYGSYIWNVKCYDTSGNYNFSSENRTMIIAGDLFINSSGIKFSKENPIEGDSIMINATVHNLADKNETDVLIRFYEGNPDNGGIQINSDIIVNITALNNKTVNVSWTAKIGSFDFFVKVDPEDNIIESDENNNKANNSLSISSYHIYYGKTITNVLLDNAFNMTVFSWFNETNITGNIYVIDSDSSIDWTSLYAIGRNDTNGFQVNDWEEVDSLLNMTNLTDSINNTYILNSQPKNLTDFIVRGSTIYNVSFVNSTNSSDFITGIMWDRSDSGTNTYYDENEMEDLVFVTKLNPNNEGKYGNYDYEIKIPANLRKYRVPNNYDSVSIYTELE